MTERHHKSYTARVLYELEEGTFDPDLLLVDVVSADAARRAQRIVARYHEPSFTEQSMSLEGHDGWRRVIKWQRDAISVAIAANNVHTDIKQCGALEQRLMHEEEDLREDLGEEADLRRAHALRAEQVATAEKERVRLDSRMKETLLSMEFIEDLSGRNGESRIEPAFGRLQWWVRREGRKYRALLAAVKGQNEDTDFHTMYGDEPDGEVGDAASYTT